jgi:hypothetical protein
MLKKINYLLFPMMIMTACTRELPQPTWNNPFDSEKKDYVDPLAPVIEAPRFVVVRWDQEAVIQAAAEDPNGSIKKYFWKSSADSLWDTTLTPVWKVRHPEGGKVVVTVGAIDNDGLASFAKTSVLFNRRPETVTLEYPYDGIRHVFDDLDFSDTIGKILAYGLSATDPDGADDSLRFVCEITDTLCQKTRRIKDIGSSFWIDSLLPDRYYLLTYKAFDRYGDSVERQINFLSQNYFPKGLVFFPRDQEHGVNHPFWIDTTEVTRGEYAEVMGTSVDSGSLRLPFALLQGSLPSDFLYTINQKYNQYKSGTGFRLPLNKEWLRAYKNPANTTPYYWGSATHQDMVKKYAWYNLNANADVWTVPHAARDGVQPVAQLLPNEYGLYDMSGNAQEYTCDLIEKSSPLDFDWSTVKLYGGHAYSGADGLSPNNPGGNTEKPTGFRKVFGQIYQ